MSESMNEKRLLKIAKRSSKIIELPRRTPIKNFVRRVWSDLYIHILWMGVKLKVVSFYKWEAYCFNREI